MRQLCPLFLFLFFITTAQAGTLYKYPDKPDTERLISEKVAGPGESQLQFREFNAIYRYPSLHQNSEGTLDNPSQQVFEQIKSQLADMAGQEILVTLIGHSQKNYKTNEDIHLPTTFTRTWQRLGETIPPQQDKTSDTTENNMEKIRQLLIDNGIDESQIYLENRNGFDDAFVEYGRSERKSNWRVDVTIYDIKDRDSDEDGVMDREDRCPGTGPGLIVDSRGCPKILTLYLEFGFDSNKLRKPLESDTKQQLDQLKEFAELLHKHPEYRAIVIGYTDSIGDEEYNRKLSLRRAETIRNLLIDEGISEYRIGIDGLGEKYPLAPNDTEEGWRKNRRIELQLLTE